MAKCCRYILLILVTLNILTGCKSSQNKLHVFSWMDQVKPAIIEKFEREYNCKVLSEYYDSNESMYAKLKAGASGYDVIFPSGYYIDLMLEQGMLHPLNPALIPNLKYIDEKYNLSGQKDFDYSVPYFLGYTGIAYRKDKVKDLESAWTVFGNSSYKGRMTMLDDLREVIGAALKTLGYSLNTTDQNQIDEAANLAIQWKKDLAKYESVQFKNGIATAEFVISQGFSGDTTQVMMENDNVGFLFPKEGFAVNQDFMVIPKDAEHVDLAHAFINFLQEPAIAAENMEYKFYLCPNKAAYALLSEKFRTNPYLFPSEDVLAKGEPVKYLGEAGLYYNEAWEKIKEAN